MKKIFLSVLAILYASLSSGQFTGNGKIYFERKTNLKMSMKYEWGDDNGDNPWMAAMLEKMPKYLTSYFTLSFNESKSMYAFDKDEEIKMPMFGGKGPARENLVITDFTLKKVTAQKEIYETNFIVTDSFKKLQWKIEDEIRPIAGYSCRKAVTTICDSVVVVAFYTDQIMVSGGPESFNGLPGMILGLAVPRLYTTWFATRVELEPFDDKTIKEMKKGKNVSTPQLMTELSKSLKDWGKYGFVTLWWASL